MKILHIMAYSPEYIGGYSVYCRNLIKNLISKGIECEVLTSNYNRISKKGEYSYNKTRVVNRRYWGNLFGINPMFGILPFLNKHYKDYDIIHAHSYIFFSTIQAALFRKIHKFPLVIQLHGGVQTDDFYSSTLFEKLQLLFKKIFFDPIIGKTTLKTPDSLVSVSFLDLQTVLKQFKVKRKNNYWIPNAVDITKFKPLKESKRNYITFVGRLSYIKGFDIFLKIAELIHAKNKNIEFLIVGEGPLQDSLEEYRNKIPIKQYLRIPYNEIVKIYNQSRILLITSRYEGIPATMLEAMACGTPVVASRIGGIPEVIRNPDHGSLFDLNDLQEAASICLKVFDKPDQSSLDSDKIRDYIQNHFSWEIITEKMIKVYNDLIE